MEYRGNILQLSASNGGVPKHALDEAEVTEEGFTTDRQADRRAHGGPMRALCIFSAERLGVLAGEGHNLAPGHLGENVTVEGLDWDRVKPGSLLHLGNEVECEVTAFAEPCWKNARWFRDGDITRIAQDVNPGYSRVYAKVLQGGVLHPGDEAVVINESAATRVRRQQPKTFRWSPPS